MRRRLALTQKSCFLEAIYFLFDDGLFARVRRWRRTGAPARSMLPVFVYTLSFCVRRRRYVGPLALAKKSSFLEAIYFRLESRLLARVRLWRSDYSKVTVSPACSLQ